MEKRKEGINWLHPPLWPTSSPGMLTRVRLRPQRKESFRPGSTAEWGKANHTWFWLAYQKRESDKELKKLLRPGLPAIHCSSGTLHYTFPETFNAVLGNGENDLAKERWGDHNAESRSLTASLAIIFRYFQSESTFTVFSLFTEIFFTSWLLRWTYDLVLFLTTGLVCERTLQLPLAYKLELNRLV